MIEDIEKLVNKLRSIKSEETWFEFKVNNANAETIAQNISAMANTATIEERECGYLIWGIDDITHELKPTSVDLKFQKVGNNDVRVTLYNQILFDNIPLERRLWSVYLHACIQYVNRKHLTNSSIRERFGMMPAQKVRASRLIAQLQNKGLIKPFDSTCSPKMMSYVPYWC